VQLLCTRMHMPCGMCINLNEFVYRVHFTLAIDTQWAHCLQGDDVHVGLGRDHRLDVLDRSVHDEVSTERARDEVAADIGADQAAWTTPSSPPR